MLSRFNRKIGSFLGLLAILMVTFAPTISQAVAASRDLSALPDALCSAHATSDHQQDNTPDPHSIAAHWQACGYCNLLAHMPALPTVQATFAATVWAIQHRIATRFESVRRIASFTAAQPRAPPVSS
ncbi:DUF2946 domain-containing protein [Pararobbsia alpina]|uniref:DUF2946 domain-containing protein n=1 Tax=Pararobbsia alpina TaxID=621374 RepID=UPI0015814FE6|nr:DUF2946 domain-containing protein [Pararobbsia alpina]